MEALSRLHLGMVTVRLLRSFLNQVQMSMGLKDFLGLLSEVLRLEDPWR